MSIFFDAEGNANQTPIPPRPPLIRIPIYRLLILDSFNGHIDLRCMRYCLSFDILIVRFPSHSTHLMQPLDVGVFNPSKSGIKR
jgi:hypothetical protein